MYLDNFYTNLKSGREIKRLNMEDMAILSIKLFSNIAGKNLLRSGRFFIDFIDCSHSLIIRSYASGQLNKNNVFRMPFNGRFNLYVSIYYYPDYTVSFTIINLDTNRSSAIFISEINTIERGDIKFADVFDMNI